MENKFLIHLDTKLGWLNKSIIEFNKLSVGTCLLEFEVTNNRVLFDLSDKRVMIEVLTPSGSTIEEHVEMIDAKNGTFEKKLSTSMITEVGIHYIELSIYNDDDTKLLCTSKARYSVGENFGEKNATVTSQYATLQECIMQTKEVQESVLGNAEIVDQAKNEATTSASNSIASSQASKESAKSAYESSIAVDNILELAKQSAEASKQSAEASKSSADEADRAKDVAIQASNVANQASSTANQASINAEQALQDTIIARTNAQQAESSAINSAVEASIAEQGANTVKLILDQKISEIEVVKDRVDETVSTANNANNTANVNLSQINDLTETNNRLIDVATSNTIKADQAIADANATKLIVDQAVIDSSAHANRAKSEADRAQGIATGIGDVKSRLDAVEAKNTQLDTNKYDDVVADINMGTLTFKANGQNKKTVQVGSSTVSSDKVQFSGGTTLTQKQAQTDASIAQASSDIKKVETDYKAADIALEGEISKKVTLDNETKENFNFIGNKVVQDGLVDLFNTSTSGGFSIYAKLKPYTQSDWIIDTGVNSTGGLGLWNSADNRLVLNYGNGTKVTQITIENKRIYEFNFSLNGNTIIVQFEGKTITKTLSDYVHKDAKLTKGSNVIFDKIITYDRVLTNQEIAHNFNVLNNSPSLKSLETTDGTGKKTTILLGSDSDHVENRCGYTLEESNTELLKAMAKEHISTTGADITVANGIGKQRVIGAEIQGQTVKNYLGGNSQSLIANNTSSAVVRYINTPINIDHTRTYFLYVNVKQISGSGRARININHTDNAIPFDVAINKVGITMGTFTPSKQVKQIDFIAILPDSGNTISCDIDFMIFDNYYQISSYIPFGLTSTVATISNNGIKYPLYASLEDKAQKKQILLGGVDGVNDNLTLNSDGSGTLMKNTFKGTINGSESWIKDATFATHQGFLLTNYNNLATAQLPISDKLPRKPNLANPYTDNVGFATGGSIGHLLIYLPKAEVPDVTALKAFLANNPITLICKTATPTTYTIDKSVNEPIATTSQINIFSAGEAVKASSFKVNVPVNRSAEIDARLAALEQTTINLALQNNK